MKIIKLLLLSSATIFLASCATTTSFPKAPKSAPSIPSAQSTEIKDAYVRWGGKVINLENKAEGTFIEILAKPLSNSGQPRSDKSSVGRFIAFSNNFMDPEDVKKGSYISVYGKITGYRNQKINEYDYRYPLVSIENYKLHAKVAARTPTRTYRNREPYWGRHYNGSYNGFYNGYYNGFYSRPNFHGSFRNRGHFSDHRKHRAHRKHSRH